MIVVFGILIVIGSIAAVIKGYRNHGSLKKMSKTPFTITRPKHRDVEFLTDDEDDFENKSKPDYSSRDDSKSLLKNINKNVKQRGQFNWSSDKKVRSMSLKRKICGDIESRRPNEVTEITDDETDNSFSPKKDNIQHNVFSKENQPESSAETDTSKLRIEDPQITIHHRLMISKVLVDFPVRPYPCQTAVMSMLIKGCTNNQNCLLESPTGSGKTLALLCSSLAWQNHFAQEAAREEARQMKEYGSNQSQIHTDERFYYRDPTGKAGSSKDPEHKCGEGEKNMMDMDMDDSKINENIDEPTRKRPAIPKIYYGSRTHKQIEQVVRELRKTNYTDKKMTILSSREHSCIQTPVKKSKTQLCNELLDPLKKIGCPYYTDKNRNNMGSNIRLQNYEIEGPWDLEDLVQLGKEIGCCPYFSARQLMQEADIIFCPYNYIIDPVIRETMQLELKDQIIILDEAHNIEDICRNVASKTIREDELEQVIEECKNLKTAKDLSIQFTFENIYSYCQLLIKFLKMQTVSQINDGDECCSAYWKGPELMHLLDINGMGYKQIKSFVDSSKKAIADYINAKENVRDLWRENPKPKPSVVISQNTKRILEDLLFLLEKISSPQHAQDFRACITENFVREFKTVAEEDTWTPTQRPLKKRIKMLKLNCMYPGAIFKPLSDLARSIILASGTLAPINSFQSELGTTFPNTLQAKHVIPESQVYVRGIAYGPSGVSLKANYTNTNLFSFKDDLGKLLVQVCQSVPHGVLCFFSSYKMMNSQIERWRETSIWNELEKTKHILMEPRFGNELDEVMSEFRSVIRDTSDSARHGITGALLFAVFRGKVAEGIDFSDNEARCVLTIGIPFAVRKDPSVDMKMMYNDLNRSKGLQSGSDWYSIQAFRALNQALGRCIRHKNDWGAVLIVDERFVSANTVSNLPKWIKTMWQSPARVNLQDELKEFVKIQKIKEEGLNI